MRHREHINTACIILAAAEILCASPITGRGARLVFPFLGSVSGFAALGITSVFYFGVMFPDFDLRFYPHHHRILSPLHNITYAAFFYIIFVLLCRFYAGTCNSAYTVLIFISAFAFGWSAHLAGDIAQGGVGYFPSSTKRIGNTERTSRSYNIILDTALYIAAICSAVLSWFICRRIPGNTHDILISQGICWLIFAHSPHSRSMWLALTIAAAMLALCST